MSECENFCLLHDAEAWETKSLKIGGRLFTVGMTPPPSSLSPPQSWERLLRTPHPRDHVVQLYTDEQFLGRAVAHFLGAGLRDGGAAVIIGTPAHVRVISDRLDTAGVEIPKAVRRGQLVIADAEQCLARFMRDGLPERAAFLATVLPILETIRAAGYLNIRLFGEMVNLLWDHNLEATVQLEEMWNEVLADQGVSLLCAYRIDPFDVRAHRGVLHQISRCHSHLVPVDDYDRLDRAVERALGDTFGQDAPELRQLIATRYPVATSMPASEAALFAVRKLSPSIADTLLERTRHHYRAR